MSEILHPPLKLNDWLNDSGSIAAAAEACAAYYQELISLYRAFGPVPSSLSSSRWLSEYGICPSIHQMPLPAGFNAVKGYALFAPDPNRPREVAQVEHHFAYSAAANTILCPTFAQFFKGNEAQLPQGARVRHYQQRSPQLIHLYPEYQLAILVGDKHDIARRLGILYITNPKSLE